MNNAKASPQSVPLTDVTLYRASINAAIREGPHPNIHRQLDWLGYRDGQLLALQTLPHEKRGTCYLALTRSVDQVIARASNMLAPNRWARVEAISCQGVYLILNSINDRLSEAFPIGDWAIMTEGIVTDGAVVSRRALFFDLDTLRRDERGHKVEVSISATVDELRRTVIESFAFYDALVTLLTAIGIDRPRDALGICMSGNGIQIWVRLADIPESQTLHEVIRELLIVAHVLYKRPEYEMDVSVHDAKRLAPLAGTLKRKGMLASLHRRVTFDGSPDPRALTYPELKELSLVWRRELNDAQLEEAFKIVGQVTRPQVEPPRSNQERTDWMAMCNRIPIREVAAALGIDAENPTCPGCHSGGDTSVKFIRMPGGEFLNCKHKRCSARPNRTGIDLVALVAFQCPDIKGTKGVTLRIKAWYRERFGGVL